MTPQLAFMLGTRHEVICITFPLTSVMGIDGFDSSLRRRVTLRHGHRILTKSRDTQATGIVTCVNGRSLSFDTIMSYESRRRS